jgi:IS30 family transposase
MAGKKGRQTMEKRAKASEFMAKNERKGRICVIFKIDCAVAAKTTDVHFGKVRRAAAGHAQSGRDAP